MNKYNFSDLAVKYGAWSLSKANVATQCNYRFQLQYIEKKKQKAVVDSRGRVGSAAHKALELIMKGEEIGRAFTKAAVDDALTTKEVDDLVSYRTNILSFIERVKKYKERNPITKEFIEYKFGLDIDLKPTTFFAKNVFFRGVWDVALLLEKKAFIIIDHKTGQEMPMSKYNDQLHSYAVAARSLQPDLIGAQSALHYIKTEKIDWAKFIPKEDIDEILIPWFVKFINDSASNLTNEIKPVKGWYCTFCGYKDDCPAWA